MFRQIILEKKNNLGKVAVAIGVGVGSAASLILVQVAAMAPNISFAPGSEFIFSVSPQRK